MSKEPKEIPTTVEDTTTIINIIVLTDKQAEQLMSQLTPAFIVSKVREHIKKTGSAGLAGDILNTFK